MDTDGLIGLMWTMAQATDISPSLYDTPLAIPIHCPPFPCSPLTLSFLLSPFFPPLPFSIRTSLTLLCETVFSNLLSRSLAILGPYIRTSSDIILDTRY